MKMKNRIIAVVKKTIESVASVSSETTSILGLYQPKTLKSLVKSDKKWGMESVPKPRRRHNIPVDKK